MKFYVHFVAPKKDNRDYNSQTFQVFRVINVGFSIDIARCTGVRNNFEHFNASRIAKTKHRWFQRSHLNNLIARLCITSTWPFDISLKKTRKLFVDRSISLKFERMIANELRKIFPVLSMRFDEEVNATKFVASLRSWAGFSCASASDLVAKP